MPPLTKGVARLAAVGVAAVALVAVTGELMSRLRFGATDEDAVARARSEVEERFNRAAQALNARAARVAPAPEDVQAASYDVATVRRLFERLDRALPAESRSTAGITVYDSRGTPVAWSGRVSDLTRDRVDGPQALFMAIGALGPRLISVVPIPDQTRPAGPRIATLVLEEFVSGSAPAALADRFVLPTSVADVAIRTRPGPTTRSPYAFTVQPAGTSVLVEAEISPEDLREARDLWRRRSRAAWLTTLAVVLLFCAAPILQWRRHHRGGGAFLSATGAVVVLLLAARLTVELAANTLASPLPEAARLGPDALLLAGLAWIGIDLLERRRLQRRSLHVVSTVTAAGLAAAYVAVGAVAALLLIRYQGVLEAATSRSPVDLLHFSLHPVDAFRLSIAFGLILLHAGVLWTAAGVMRLPAVVWRTRRSTLLGVGRATSCAIGVGLVIGISTWSGRAAPVGPFLAAALAAGAGTAWLSRRRRGERRKSRAARLGELFGALVLPALAMYPSLYAFTLQAKEQLVASEFAPQAASQREDLQLRRLPHALEAIDAMPALDTLVTGSDETAAPTTDRAFIVWSQTELSSYRTTSAVELYGPNGQLVSRFALNLPEYTTPTYQAGRCEDWELYEEVSPFGSSRRHVLRASRAICTDRRRVGAVVVRAMLDYQSLPFIASDSPYVEWLRPSRRGPSEDAFGRDIEFVFFGWSRAPLYASGARVWPLADDVFARLVESRAPFWTSVTRDGDAFRVYFFNDRGGIYALGYPLITPLGHVINLGELVFLAGVVYALLLVLAALFRTATAQTPAGGRALLGEIRASFYRRLFIAFVASAVLPVVVLAFATRAYFVNQFERGVRDSAEETAKVAQRLVEDYAALQQLGAGALDQLDDQFMVLVRRAIDQDVNLFDRTDLQATSERDLFASGVIPTRTPSEVYRRIVLDRLPTFVGEEEVAGLPYLLAAAPVRAGMREGIVTVPQAPQQQAIEQQIDELDRRVLSVSVLFVLLGAALGYGMAERIADPVSRLTRATRRIARGDLDARIAAASSDELGRLVEDFNTMAEDLKRQRSDLERSQRLEAWADMARQVAHDIKNPLTPIQLSAEHARRVNLDRGRPLSPALDECVNAILAQVQLLRQIAAEFSSFASSPTARPEPTAVAALIEEVVEPYRAGLEGRVTVLVDAAPDLPRVLVDRTLFARALTNVIENALNAMPGGGRLSIVSHPDQEPGARKPPGVAIDIADTGVGMDPDALARIFEPYFSTKTTGTGLGLTIAKRNVELNGGTIRVTSRRGEGTRVTITLPVASDT
jgi:signal transduction histidine kinase